MKKLLLSFMSLCAVGYSAQNAMAQQMVLNIAKFENGQLDDSWNVGATGATIQVQITNVSFTTALPAYKIKPLIKLDNSAYCKWQVNANQTDLPAGWTILSNSGTAMQLSNGTDAIAPGDQRTFELKVTCIAPTPAPYQLATGQLSWSNGIAPGNVSGAPSAERDPIGEYSTTGYRIVAQSAKLLSFNASANGCDVFMTWKADRQNADHFNLQHSTDNQTFTTIGSVPGQNASNDGDYKYEYSPSSSGKAYYRVEQVDRDGRNNYTNVQEVATDCRSSVVSLSPNPTRGQITVTGLNGNNEIKVYNAAGQLLESKLTTTNIGQIDLSAYTPGFYQIIVVNGSKRVLAEKVMKQ